MFFRAGRVCCISGCRNSEARNPELHFYTLPGRKYEVDRKKRWIEAIKKTKGTDDSWTPSIYTRVCSAHFRGGKKSSIEKDEAYVPSIFPGLSAKNNLPTHQDEVARCSGGQYPEASISTTVLTGVNEDDLIIVMPMDVEKIINTESVACQTDSTDSPKDPPEEPNIMFCWIGYNEASTQTQIFVKPKSSSDYLLIR